MSDIFEHLNGSDALLGADTAEGDGSTEPSSRLRPELAEVSGRRRVLGRLGEYVELVVAPLNMRPRQAMLVYHSAERVEVRVSSAGSHVLVVIGVEGDLAAEAFVLRALAGQRLPIPQLLTADVTRTRIPFSYAIEGYHGGSSLNLIDDATLVHGAARQLGRALRRAHQTRAPAFGAPAATGRWPTLGWRETLGAWLTRRQFFSRAEAQLGEWSYGALSAATFEHPSFDDCEPHVTHGAIAPARAIVTVGEYIQLEALIRPGEIVGGDPLFDLAFGMLPRHPEPFRRGLHEGYCAAGALSEQQETRLRRLWLLLWVADILDGHQPEAWGQLSDIIAAEVESIGSV